MTCTAQMHQAQNLRGGTLMTCTAQMHQAQNLRGGTLITCTAQISPSTKPQRRNACDF